MKNRIKTYLLVIAVLFTACNEDFLERYPLDAMSDVTFFTKESDLKSYMNGMYDGIIRNQANNKWINLENGSDNLVTNSPANVLMRHSETGLAPETDNVWEQYYDYIRKANYFIENAKKVPASKVANHYKGEGYYCRAFKYFELLQRYGGVPYIDKVLNTDSEELYKTRDSRNFIASKIIQDLDSAIVNLHWKGEGEAVLGRINKEAALVMKSRVGLFEGSWEYYHGKENTPFSVSGSNYNVFLEAAVSAGDQLIARQGSNIFIGSAGKEYQDYFNQYDYSTIKGAYLYKAYSQSLGIINQWYRPSTQGLDCGLTKSCVDAYLMKDGKPAEISSIANDNTKLNLLAANKDPRLGQSMYYPEKGTINTVFQMPGLIIQQERWPSYPGYKIWKGIVFDASELDNGQTDDLIIRYEEALLNYAEAKAILGTLTQADIDKSINVIRSRVNMVPMNLSEINAWAVTYTKANGYDPSAANILNEIRRERRIELVIEGFRYDDLRRWALLPEVFNGKKPVGAHLQEYIDYWNNGKKIIEAGFKQDTATVKLKIGINVDKIDGYINPFYQNSDFKANSGRGYYIDSKRDYLSPIPKEEISLYRDKGGVTLEQNPGWF